MSYLSIRQSVLRYINIGDDMRYRIRDLREDRDLKQREIAEYLLCDQSLYSKYERGERPVPIDILNKLADFYGTSIDYLIGRTDQKEPYPRSNIIRKQI